MKAVILAGGLGTRISEETDLKPKPMVEVGGRPILWHIMKIFSYYGINEFIICLGVKADVIKHYFYTKCETIGTVVLSVSNFTDWQLVNCNKCLALTRACFLFTYVL